MRRILILLFLLLAVPAAAAELKLATWNIAWLTLKPTGHPGLPRNVEARTPADFQLLRAYANRLAADVVALQEIDGEEAAARIFDPAHWTIHLTDEADIQRPGFAIRRTLRVTPQPDLRALDLHPRARFSLRRGADILVEAPGGARLRLLSVHLDAGCRQDPFGGDSSRDCQQLERQARILAQWAAARAREGVGFAILGDFNRRMTDSDDFLTILEEAAPLARPTRGLSSPCWADSRGGRPFVSHFLLGGEARDWLVPDSLAVMVYAERARRYRQTLSDHCPMSIRLNLP
ncbi:endonuclease/exonuclease/phosphatase family protein [Falsiroseomonas sp.]|uniref:endonuclease/exonuclease/phosphatase family protein n=1 Tax=Falsiroseomonas sp. TaxID=2870721 RepID=UPI00273432D7|nr:endonuclease/exonuclease/phosphatase family protein [Falsiroseomonas sp.]MDP3417921.1 endonuclease/exonuclease/phosphatase family protein [Falsiroseomonas sp.]